MHVISITTPIFLLIAIGFAAVRGGIISRDVSAGIGRFVLYFAVPSLIFQTLLKSAVREAVEPLFLLAYAAASLLAFTAGYLLLRRVSRAGASAAGAGAFGMSMSNSAFVGSALLMQSFEHPPMGAFAMVLLIENILMMPLALTIMELGVERDGRPSLRATWKMVANRIARHPIILAIVAGTLCSLVGLRLPDVIDRSLSLLAQSSTAAALFSIGGMLVGISWRAHAGSACVIAAGKLVLHPLLVLTMLALLPAFDPRMQRAAIVLASAPMVSIYPIIVGSYGHGEQAAATILVTTVCAFFSISTILWFVL